MKRALSPIPFAVMVGVLVLIALLAYGLATSNHGSGTSDLIGKLAPAPSLPVLAGGDESSSLTAHRGQVVLLNYWASWCDPCRNEAPLLERWYERIKAKGAVILGVDSADVRDDGEAFVRRYGITYPMLWDGSGDSGSALGIIGYPESFVVGRDGRIAAAMRGPVDDGFMRTRVLPLVEKSRR